MYVKTTGANLNSTVRRSRVVNNTRLVVMICCSIYSSRSTIGDSNIFRYLIQKI